MASKRTPKDPSWLQERVALIRELALNPQHTRQDIARVAARLDLTPRSIRRLVSKWRNMPTSDSVDPSASRRGPRATRLRAEVEVILEATIQDYFLGTKEWRSIKALHAHIEERCLAQDLTAPSPSTVKRRVEALSKMRLAKARKIKGEDRDYQATPHHHEVPWPLDEIQVDHTPMDVLLDLEAFGLGKKRPWLTLAIDVATRMVFGYYIGLKAPTARTTGLALMMGMLPKRPWVEACGVAWQAAEQAAGTDPWPLTGVPRVLATDNGSDFRSSAARSACNRFGIRQRFRKVGRPHEGGHIERLIGTFMTAVHELPGTTDSNPQARGDYDSEAHAFLTLEDLECWLVLRILEYHLTPHKGLDGLTPLQKYAELEAVRPRCYPMTVDEIDIRSAFLPTENRRVRNQGIRLLNRYYYSPALSDLVGRRVAIKYHPARIDRLYVCLDGLKPVFEALPIGKVGRCQHRDALVDRLPTVAVAAETKRQAAVARRLLVQRDQLIDQARRSRRTRPPAIAPAPTASLRHQVGRPLPSQPDKSPRG
ncbi:Mu transposase C-terminal domain-containing protein [Pseudokordiimonas caeni]|uniref:Mu transposase C-terminal domain-containing protein n=1 Tax=Pseudokordiimonas caeni TaxID=2997908 RepID=UPI002810C2BC|nr:Mu transposase C-terminal domain-containing protein [Pseudokordiimonas caeni]